MHIARVFVVVLMFAAVARAETPPLKSNFAFENSTDTTFQCGGRLGEYTQAITQNWLLVAPDRNPAMLGMFADREKKPYRDLLPWSGEFAGKYLTAGTEVLRLTGDPALRTYLQNFVNRFVALQDEDGYLGPFPKDARLVANAPNCKATWDAWGHYHAMLGLLLWNRQVHDVKALHTATKIGDLLCNHFLGNGHRVLDMGSPDQNQAIAHGLCLLYEVTGTQRYLDLAEQVVGEFEVAGAGDYVRTALAGQEFYATPKPRWESLHAIMALPEIYRITGNESYRKAFEHIWWSIVKLDRHNNGGFSSGEQAVGDPYNPAAIETCCTIAWIAMSHEMLHLTGDPVVADELELSTLNQVFALQSRDGKWCTYNTPMDGVRTSSLIDIAFQKRPGSEELNCCSVNAARGFGMVSDWALLRDAGGAVVLNWYGPSTFTTLIAGHPVALRQETDYPRSGHVVIHVDPDSDAEFPLLLRIPNWSRATSVAVNGQAVADVAPAKYLKLNRIWKREDEVTIDFDFSLRAWAGERGCAGKASLYRGPLLLAYETPQDNGLKVGEGWIKLGEHWVSKAKGAAIEGEFSGDSVKWLGLRYDDAGKAQIQVDGKDVELVDQYGPKRGEPFSWQHSGFGAGRHTIRLSISGEKVPASRGTWTNVIGFGATAPSIDLHAMKPRLLDAAPGGPIASLEVTDVSGTKVALSDYGSVGMNGKRYITWIPAPNAKVTEFAKDNPLRTSIP